MLQTFKTLPDAIALAEFAHRNQTDKAGLPYIDHPRRVLQKVQAQGALPFVQMAAILHDVTEDTTFTPEILLTLGFSEAVVSVVKLLDRNVSKERWAAEYVGYGVDLGDHDHMNKYYYIKIRENPAARLVKFADIDDNLEPWRLSYLEEATQQRLRLKYKKARNVLGFTEFLND